VVATEEEFELRVAVEIGFEVCKSCWLFLKQTPNIWIE